MIDMLSRLYFLKNLEKCDKDGFISGKKPIAMEPHLAKNDKIMFYKYLNKANIYFEYGSGGSTYQAAIRNNIKQIYSVESNYDYYNMIKTKLGKIPKLLLIYNEMDSPPNTWGNPGPNSTVSQQVNYSNQIINIKNKKIDLILIDGRFRVACCLKCHSLFDDCVILFDDFLDRSYYHIVLLYFKIVDKTEDNRMVVLKKIPNTSVPDDIIKEYELNPR
jgi:protein O-GlcNAc transferase